MPAPALAAPPADAREQAFARRFGDALTAGDPSAAESVAKAAIEAGMDVASVHSRVIAPAMYRVGDLWQHGDASVADEHLATAISQNVLGRLFPFALRVEPRSRERVMLAAPQGEHHVLGLRMAGDVLEGAGFDVLYLGADVPAAALVEACRTHSPAVLGLTVTMPLNAPTLIQAIEVVCELAEPPAILVAGHAARLVIEQGLAVPIVERSEDVVAVLEQLLGEARNGRLVPRALALRMPPTATQGQTGVEGALRTESAFSATALAAAETARDAARHAFAMQQLAYHDPLTGLWNRRGYDDRFQELADDDAIQAVVLRVDLDDFKRINDTFGHEVGDATLIGIAKSMQRNARPGDFVARLGGDEFSILLAGVSLADAAAIGERIRAGIEREVRDPDVTVSIGVVQADSNQRSTSLAVDLALYEAKQNGRNRVVVVGA
jgi:diguanylate cyclase (GGDEF)-like protein